LIGDEVVIGYAAFVTEVLGPPAAWLRKITLAYCTQD